MKNENFLDRSLKDIREGEGGNRKGAERTKETNRKVVLEE